MMTAKSWLGYHKMKQTCQSEQYSYHLELQYQMNIQIFFLICLATLLLSHIWKLTFPTVSFLETHCIIGQISLPSGNQKLIDCSSCLTYPIDTHQKGTVSIRNGSPQQLKQTQQAKDFEFYANLYQQEECIEYECQDLISEKSFNNIEGVGKAGLDLLQEVSRVVNENVWEIHLQYDNHRGSEGKGLKSVKINLIHYLMGHLIPSPLLPARQFYSGMALKLRYTQPSEKSIENIGKPVIKFTESSQSSSDFMAIALLISFTLAFKSDFFRLSHHTKAVNILMCLSFISPYLFSIFAIALFAFRTPLHLFSLFFMVFGLCVDYPSLLLIGIAASSVLQLRQSNKAIDPWSLITFNLLIALSAYLGIESITSTAFCQLYALCEQKLGKDYEKLSRNEKTGDKIEFKESDQIITFRE